MLPLAANAFGRAVEACDVRFSNKGLSLTSIQLFWICTGVIFSRGIKRTLRRWLGLPADVVRYRRYLLLVDKRFCRFMIPEFWSIVTGTGNAEQRSILLLREDETVTHWWR